MAVPGPVGPERQAQPCELHGPPDRANGRRRRVPGRDTARGIRLGGCAASPSGTRGRLPLAPALRSGLRPAASGHIPPETPGPAAPGARHPVGLAAGLRKRDAGSGDGNKKRCVGTAQHCCVRTCLWFDSVGG